MKEHGVPAGVALQVLGILGAGVNNYKTKSDKDKQLGIRR
jgi:hypothetical protein